MRALFAAMSAYLLTALSTIPCRVWDSPSEAPVWALLWIAVCLHLGIACALWAAVEAYFIFRKSLKS